MIRVAMVGHVDHGKSTLIGRLLADTGQAREERQDKILTLCESTGRKFEYAFLLDAFEEEQAQGITMDVTEVQWRYQGREFLFVDTPGHREFLKKMVGGASKVDAAVVLVDAQEGVKDSFLRQMKVLDLLGVKNRLVLLNKMDLIDWSEALWLKRRQEIQQALVQTAAKVEIIPVAAWHGANLLKPAHEMPWYQGPSFVEALLSLDDSRLKKPGPTRFFIQDVFRTDEKRWILGRLDSGSIKLGDELQFFPGGYRSRVCSLEIAGEPRQQAQSGDSLALTLADPLFLDRGYLAHSPNQVPSQSQVVTGDLFWLNQEPLKVGDQVKVKMGTRQLPAKVLAVDHEIHGETLAKVEGANSISLFGRVKFQFNENWAFDSFEECEPTGRFVVATSGLPVGGGRWLKETELNYHVPFAVRGEQQKSGMVLWFTGLSGAGKSTLAQALERQLCSSSRQVFVLDGDVLRQGLCRDLGFSEDDRTENIRRAAELAKLLADRGFLVITAFISPLEKQRRMAREIISSSRFFEIFVDCPLSICEQRDVKGLYAQARSGEILKFTGVSAPFEAPSAPDLHLSTGDTKLEHSIELLMAFLNQKSKLGEATI